MTIIEQVGAWLTDPANWQGSTGIPARTAVYLGHCALTLLLAAVIAVPLGLYIGHTGKGRAAVVPLLNAVRALPTLGLVTVLSLLMGLGLGAPLLALTLIAIPSMLAGTYAGVESVEPEVIDAAKSMGFTGRQLLWHVELPLALPQIIGGVRSACIQVIATWTVAAYLPIEGLGRYLIDGLAMHDYPRMLGGSVIVIVLALLANIVLTVAERLAVPTGVRLMARTHVDK